MTFRAAVLFLVASPLACGGLLEDENVGTTVSCQGIGCSATLPKLCVAYANSVARGTCTTAMLNTAQESYGTYCTDILPTPGCGDIVEKLLACYAGVEKECTKGSSGSSLVSMQPNDCDAIDPDHCLNRCGATYVCDDKGCSCTKPSHPDKSCCRPSDPGCLDEARFCARLCSPCND